VRLEFTTAGLLHAVVQDPVTKIRDTGSQSGMVIPFLHPHPGKGGGHYHAIEEGDLYHLGTITFKGAKAVTNMKALRRLFQIQDGDIFNRDKVSKGLEGLRKAYGELGISTLLHYPIQDRRAEEGD